MQHPKRAAAPWLIAAALVPLASPAVQAHGDLTVTSWGGAYTRSQMLAYVIPKRTPRTADMDAAMAFIAFATDTQRLADQARYISYGPARQSSLALLDEAIKPHLPTAPANAEGALRIDAEWWARNQARMERQFEHWLASKEAFELWRVR